MISAKYPPKDLTNREKVDRVFHMDINIIKKFREKKATLYSQGRHIGYMNKWVQGTFGPIAGWSVYTASGDWVAHADSSDEAWRKLFAWIADRERVLANPY